MVTPRVFAVIPVFNRLKFTLKCIECLRLQSYPNIAIIVSDGGSTDGTPQEISVRHPDVTVLHSPKELWWGGSMHLGIEHALKEGQWRQDFVLMMNNDTEIGHDYVATLVDVAMERNAAVGAVIVDSREPSHILDAGEYVCWQPYSFPLKVKLEPGLDALDNVSVLPGRGSLVPLRWIRQSGNVDADAFPHYLADYEFFYRLRSRGCPLLVTYQARLLAHIEETGLVPTSGRASFVSVWRQLFARRSMGNVIDHWRFVARHAPAKYRLQIQCQLIASICYQFLFRTRLRFIILPMIWLLRLPFRIICYCYKQVKMYGALPRLFINNRQHILCYPRKVPSSLRVFVYIFFCPGPLRRNDLESLQLKSEALLQDGILMQLSADWFAFARLQRDDFVRVSGLCFLFLKAWNPFRKLVRLAHYQFSSRDMSAISSSFRM